MKDYLKDQKVVERKPKSGLVKTLVLLGAIGVAGISAGIIGYSKGYRDASSQNETIFDRRARFLNQAEEQLKNAQNPEEINGLNSVIKDIEKGVYDYSK
jgi:hypothetical protein